MDVDGRRPGHSMTGQTYMLAIHGHWGLVKWTATFFEFSGMTGIFFSLYLDRPSHILQATPSFPDLFPVSRRSRLDDLSQPCNVSVRVEGRQTCKCSPSLEETLEACRLLRRGSCLSASQVDSMR